MVPIRVKQALAVLFIIVLVVNLIGFAMGKIGMGLFWIVLGVGFLSIHLIKSL